jgi:hypothetical protein
MEHRYATRVPLRINVLIYRQGLPVQVGRTRDISAEGAFVETGSFHGQLPDCLDLEFLPGQEGYERFRLKALVVHRNQSGFGLEFAALDDHGEVCLKQCLRRSPPPAPKLLQAATVVGYR